MEKYQLDPIVELKNMLVNIKYALENICSKSSLISLNDKKTLPKRKSTKQKKKQVIDMETLAKIIPIVATYIVIVRKKKESLLNKKSTNHKKINSKTRTTTFSLYYDVFLNSN
jgi:hypothetical protein